MQRFFYNIELGNKVSLDDKDFFHQISHVLRSRIGDEMVLFNGDGSEYIYSISEISKKSIELDFVSKTKNDMDPEIKITLYQAIPNKFEKIDYILQKGVEIGIYKFVFFSAKRSQKLVVSESKKLRFENIIRESLEQSGGNKKPEILFLDKLNIVDVKGKTIVCHTEKVEKGKLKNESKDKGINLFVGPEGGFSEEEIEEFKKAGFGFINFGKRILRTETMSSVVSFWLINN